MVFKKTILQVFSGKEPFGFDDFVRGTLRLFNYAVDNNMDVKINISGSEFEQYMIVNNFKYDTLHITPKIYYNRVDDELLVKDLDVFKSSSDPLYVITSNVQMDRKDIYNLSYVGYDTLVRYRESLYIAAQAKVQANLLYRPHSDNLLYGYSIIYIHRDELNYKITTRSLASLANQIRQSLDMNKDMMVFSNSIQLRTILSQYIEMSSFAVQKIDDSDVDIGVQESIPSIEDIMIDFIILMKSKKIYRFADTVKMNSHSLNFTKNKYSLSNLYDTAFDINTLIGNLEITSIPLYYGTYTLASALNNPSGIALDSSGNVYFSDTLNHRICKLDVLGNFSTYAGSTMGTSGFVNGNSSVARFNSPTAIAIDRMGNIYVADTGNNVIRIIQLNVVYDALGNVVTTDRLINTLVGTGVNGQSISSSAVGFSNVLNAPRGVAVDISGSLYISDTGNHRICKVISGGSLQTMAGMVSSTAFSNLMVASPPIYLSGNVNGQGEQSSFTFPTGLCVDLFGNVFVADTGNNMIRRITPSGKVSTVAGNGQPFFKEGKRLQAGFCRPTGITVDLQNILYITDSGNNVIRRITTDGNVLPVVGSPQQLSGSIDGFGAVDPTRSLVPFERRATFNQPAALAVDSSKILYVADKLNNTIRKIVPTFSTPTKIKPIAMQALRISKSYGMTHTLGPSLTQCPQNSMVYGHKRGT